MKATFVLAALASAACSFAGYLYEASFDTPWTEDAMPGWGANPARMEYVENYEGRTGVCRLVQTNPLFFVQKAAPVFNGFDMPPFVAWVVMMRNNYDPYVQVDVWDSTSTSNVGAFVMNGDRWAGIWSQQSRYCWNNYSITYARLVNMNTNLQIPRTQGWKTVRMRAGANRVVMDGEVCVTNFTSGTTLEPAIGILPINLEIPREGYFDNFEIGSTCPGVAYGTVNRSGNAQGYPPMLVDANGNSVGIGNWYVLSHDYAVAYPSAEPFRLRFQAVRHLTKVVEIDPTQYLTNFNVTLPAGDLYGDNIIDIADYIRFAGVFGSTSEDEDWNTGDETHGIWPSWADFNDDGFVDIGDYVILSANFSMVGE